MSTDQQHLAVPERSRRLDTGWSTLPSELKTRVLHMLMEPLRGVEAVRDLEPNETSRANARLVNRDFDSMLRPLTWRAPKIPTDKPARLAAFSAAVESFGAAALIRRFHYWDGWESKFTTHGGRTKCRRLCLEIISNLVMLEDLSFFIKKIDEDYSSHLSIATDASHLELAIGTFDFDDGPPALAGIVLTCPNLSKLELSLGHIFLLGGVQEDWWEERNAELTHLTLDSVISFSNGDFEECEQSYYALLGGNPIKNLILEDVISLDVPRLLIEVEDTLESLQCWPLSRSFVETFVGALPRTQAVDGDTKMPRLSSLTHATLDLFTLAKYPSLLEGSPQLSRLHVYTPPNKFNKDDRKLSEHALVPVIDTLRRISSIKEVLFPANRVLPSKKEFIQQCKDLGVSVGEYQQDDDWRGDSLPGELDPDDFEMFELDDDLALADELGLN